MFGRDDTPLRAVANLESTLPLPSSTTRLDSVMVRAFHAGTFRPGRATFTVVGDLGEAEAHTLLTRRRGAGDTDALRER